MAVNDRLDAGLRFIPSAISAASLETRAGGSTPGEIFWVWAFDDTSQEHVYGYGAMSSRYTGANFKVQIPWMAATATTGNVRWIAAFRRRDTSDDVDASHSYSDQGVTSPAPAAAGQPVYTEITFTQAQADGILAAELFVLRIARDVAHANDDLVGDAQLMDEGIMVLET